MTNRTEVTWVEAATIALNDSPQYWMTAPELVREIQSKGIKRLKSNYGQAVRTLRSALNIHSRKQFGMFIRSEGDFNVSFALRERIDCLPNPPMPSPTPSQRRKILSSTKIQQKSWVPVTNGLPKTSPCPTHPPCSPPSSSSSTSTTCTTIQSSPALSSCLQSPEAVTVEIDPSLKGTKPYRLNSEPGSSSCLCLPSPLTSILGQRRTLHLLNESTMPESLRPVRQVRKKQQVIKDYDRSTSLSPLLNGYTVEGPLPPPALPEVLKMETCHVLPSHLSEVAFVRPSSPCSTSEGGTDYEDPCAVQGERNSSASFEIEPKPIKKPTDVYGESFDSTSQFSSDSDSESELSDIQIQPRPTSRLFVRRLSQLKRHIPRIDYSQLSASDPNEEEESEKEVDVESVAPGAYYPRPQVSVKKQNRTRIGQFKHKFRSKEEEFVEDEKRVDQRRNISSLFQPQSPLVSENMKSILNMEAFSGLSESQKSQLVKLLPAVDRTGPSTIVNDSLNNSFFSSALREWIEGVAMGVFTTEYRAKMRADEKKRAALKSEFAWKLKFFEENWGDRLNSNDGKPPDHTPFYPCSEPSSEVSAACLNTILKAYYDEDKALPSSSSPPPLPSATPSQATPTLSTILPSHSPDHSSAVPPPLLDKPTNLLSKKQDKQGGVQSKKTNAVVRKRTNVTAVSKLKPGVSTVGTQRKNHVVKKPSQKVSLPALLGKTGKVSKVTTPAKNSVAKMKSSRIIEQLKLNSSLSKTSPNSGRYLTRLPPRTPYQTLLLALSQASKPTKVPPHGIVSTPPPQQQYNPPSNMHTHSIFHDHFALLSDSHVPSEFASPVTSLPLRLPISAYNSYLCARLTQTEHSYAKSLDSAHNEEFKGGRVEKDSQQLNLKLSVPRSLLQTSENCGCDKDALVLCCRCHSLYHSVCSNTSTFCSTCTTLMSLNLC